MEIVLRGGSSPLGRISAGLNVAIRAHTGTNTGGLLCRPRERGVACVILGRSGSDLDLGRREHMQEVGWQLSTGSTSTASKAQLLSLVERVERPTDRDRIGGHRQAG